jgi:hypothetical protein
MAHERHYETAQAIFDVTVHNMTYRTNDTGPAVSMHKPVSGRPYSLLLPEIQGNSRRDACLRCLVYSLRCICR